MNENMGLAHTKGVPLSSMPHSKLVNKFYNKRHNFFGPSCLSCNCLLHNSVVITTDDLVQGRHHRDILDHVYVDLYGLGKRRFP